VPELVQLLAKASGNADIAGHIAAAAKELHARRCSVVHMPAEKQTFDTQVQQGFAECPGAFNGTVAKDFIGQHTQAIQQLVTQTLRNEFSSFSVEALREIVKGHAANTQVLHASCKLEDALQVLFGPDAAMSIDVAATSITEKQMAAVELLLLLLETDAALVTSLARHLKASPHTLEVIVMIVDDEMDTWPASPQRAAAAQVLQLVGDCSSLGPSIQHAAAALVNSSNSEARSIAAGLIERSALGFAQQCSDAAAAAAAQAIVVSAGDSNTADAKQPPALGTADALNEQPASRPAYSSDGLQTLVSLLQHTDEDIRKQAAGALSA
jgi:hypothetical protein